MSEDSEYYEVEAIKSKKLFNNTWKYLIKWKNYPDSRNTWEPVENLTDCKTLFTAFENEYENQKQRKMQLQSSSNNEKRGIDKSLLKRSEREENEDAAITTILNSMPAKRLKKVSHRENEDGAQKKAKRKVIVTNDNNCHPTTNIMPNNGLIDNNVQNTSKDSNIAIIVEAQPKKQQPKHKEKAEQKNATSKNGSQCSKVLPKKVIVNGFERFLTHYEAKNIEIASHTVIDGSLFYLVQPKNSGVLEGGYFRGDVLKKRIPAIVCEYCERVMTGDK